MVAKSDGFSPVFELMLKNPKHAFVNFEQSTFCFKSLMKTPTVCHIQQNIKITDILIHYMSSSEKCTGCEVHLIVIKALAAHKCGLEMVPSTGNGSQHWQQKRFAVSWATIVPSQILILRENLNLKL